MSKFPGAEKREFLRYGFDKPVNYRVIYFSQEPDAASKAFDAISRNLSASGMLFSSKYLPEIASVIVLDIDYRTTRICREIEENAFIVNGKLVGKVVRVEDDGDGLYGVGVAFIRKSEHLPADIEKLIR